MADMVADTIAASAIPNQLAINNILNMVTDDRCFLQNIMYNISVGLMKSSLNVIPKVINNYLKSHYQLVC